MNKSRLLGVVCAGALSAISMSSQAAPVAYEFVPGTQAILDNSGGTAILSGGFTYDSVTSSLTSIEIYVGGATPFANPLPYTFEYAPWNLNEPTSLGVMYAANSADDSVFAMLFISFDSTLDGSPGISNMTQLAAYNGPFGNSFNCVALGCVSGGVQVAASAVPVPAAAWLFGSGLLGLIGVTRRKKA